MAPLLTIVEIFAFRLFRSLLFGGFLIVILFGCLTILYPLLTPPNPLLCIFM